MDAKVEVVAMTAAALMVTASVKALRISFLEVRDLVSQVTTSTLRFLRAGRSSLSAVPGDTNFWKGAAALV